MQRQSCGAVFTRSGSITSSTTGKSSGQHGVRSLRKRTTVSSGLGGGTGVAMSAALAGSAGRSSSCAESSASLLAPKIRRTSRSTFCRNNAFSRCGSANAAWHCASCAVSSVSRGTSVANSDAANRDPFNLCEKLFKKSCPGHGDRTWVTQGGQDMGDTNTPSTTTGAASERGADRLRSWHGVGR